jgi:hypothetical protein
MALLYVFFTFNARLYNSSSISSQPLGLGYDDSAVGVPEDSYNRGQKYGSLTLWQTRRGEADEAHD